MVLVSAAGVGAAILILAAAVLTSSLVLVYIAIGVSAAAAVLLAIGAFREYRRARTRRGVAAEPPKPASTTDAELADRVSAQGSVVAIENAPKLAPEAGDRGEARGTAARTPPAAVVLVVPGRRRFHQRGCILLTGRLSEELTIQEALEEGFTACTTCAPGPAPRLSQEEPGGAEVPPVETHPEVPPVETPARAAGARPAPPPAETHPEVPPVETPARAAGARPAPPPVETHPEVPPSEPAEDADAQRHSGQATAAAAKPGQATLSPDTAVYVLHGVSRYHLGDCVLIHVVDDDDVDIMTQGEAEAAGCTPCRACHLD